MGSRSTKPSPSLTQTLVPPSEPVPQSEPVTPPTTSSKQFVSCPVAPVKYAEWDECMRQSALTIGTTTVTAIAIGLIVPAADTLLLLGTGAGVLWSVKRCRTLMRDGILSPEQAKELEHKKRLEREEKRRQRKREKEARQKAAEELKLLEKQKKAEIGNKKGDSNECCKKLKKALEQKGLNVDDLPCKTLSHKNEGPQFNAEKTLSVGSHSASKFILQDRKLQENNRNNLGGSISKITLIDGKGESSGIPRDKPETANTQQLKSSGTKKHPKTPAEGSGSDAYSTVKLFAPYSRYLSQTVVLTCDSKECTCNSNNDTNCICDSKQLLYGQPQQYILGTDAEKESPPIQDEDPEELIIQQAHSVFEDMVEQEMNLEIQIATESTSAGDGMVLENVTLEQSTKEEDQIPRHILEEYGEEGEIKLSSAFDNIESVSDGSDIELLLEESDNLDIKIEESQGSLDVEVLNLDTSEEQIEPLDNEVEVVFAETYKSESWPFSFSLPSLDKFSKKKNNSFKWPPLTSSIIVKPKKESTCKCSGELGGRENDDVHTECTCGSTKK